MMREVNSGDAPTITITPVVVSDLGSDSDIQDDSMTTISNNQYVSKRALKEELLQRDMKEKKKSSGRRNSDENHNSISADDACSSAYVDGAIPLAANITTNGETMEEQHNVEKQSFFKSLKTHGKHEAIQLTQICWPLIITNVCNAILGATDMAFVGHLGKEELAASALGNSYFTALSFLAVGLVSAQDTLISQSVGAKNDRTKRIVLLRSLFIVSLASIPVFILFMFSEQILLLIRQDPTVSRLTGIFIRYNAIGLIPFCMINIFSRYLVAQSKVLFPMLCSILSNIVNVIMNFLLITGYKYKGLGFIGAPIATSITRIFIAAMLLCYVIHIERKHKEPSQETNSEEDQQQSEEVALDAANETPSPILTTGDDNITHATRNSLLVNFKNLLKKIFQPRGLLEFLKIAIPGMLQQVFEVWAFQCTTIIAGFLSEPKFLAAHTIVLNFCYITFTIPMSIGIACAVRIGTCLGAKQARQAQISGMMCLTTSILFMACNALQILIFRNYYGKIFTSEPDVLTLVAVAFPIASLFQIFDGAAVTLSGIMRGIGKQHIGAVSIMISFYFLGLPIGCLLAFYFKLYLNGIWIGLLLGLFAVSVILFFYVILRVDYDVEVKNALMRVAKSDIKTETEISAISEMNIEIGSTGNIVTDSANTTHDKHDV